MSDPLVTIGRYTSPVEAHIARSKLEAHGFFALVSDDHLVSVQWLYADAVGGVRLQVRGSDAAAARRLLTPATDWGAPAKQMAAYTPLNECPACGYSDVFERKSWLFMVLGLIFPAPLLIKTRGRHCRACGHEWRTEPT